AGLSLLTLLFSGWRLAVRIEAWNLEHARPIFYFFGVEGAGFTFAGKPVSITDELDERGAGEVVIIYGGDVLRLPVEIPTEYPLPGLDRHADWLRFHVFAQASGLSYEAFERALDAGEITSRLVAVVRSPHGETAKEGHFDLETEEDWGWGEVRRDRWRFTFHEFLPGGGWRSETLRFPESGKSFYRRQVKADLEGEPPPVRADDELVEGSWQYQAAIPLMNRPPSITHESQALRNAGWTLPIASASVVVLMFSLAFAVAPRRPSGDEPG
ncbi:MAG: hypothetical protein K8E66_03480, partial [Phycisphaerales bacterium]|nr:hypothetical protein [Phycisphaerales bacterium]